MNQLLEASQLFSCPHCKKPSIGIWAKYWAGTADPAVCHDCNEASSIPTPVETASTLLYVVAGIWAFMLLAFSAARIHNCSFIDCDTPISGPFQLRY